LEKTRNGEIYGSQLQKVFASGSFILIPRGDGSVVLLGILMKAITCRAEMFGDSAFMTTLGNGEVVAGRFSSGFQYL
jgi:hypothetical protein